MENERTFDDFNPPGLYDIQEPEYHGLDAVGSTLLKAAITSPKQYIHERDREREDGKYRSGSLLHQALLEPERFQRERIEDSAPPERPGSKSWGSKHHELAAYVAEGRDFDWIAENHSDGYTKSTYKKHASKDGFVALSEYYEEHDYDPDARQRYVSKSELKETLRMVRAIYRTDEVQNGLLAKGETEKTLLTPFNGINGKARFDFLSSDRDYFVDVKTTRKIPAVGKSGVKDWSRQLGSLGYHFQLAYYAMLATEVLGTFPYAVILAVQNKPPYHTGCITIRREHFEKAIRVVEYGVEQVKKAEKSGYSLKRYDSIPDEWIENPDIPEIHDKLKSDGSDNLGLPSGIQTANLRDYDF